MIEPDCAIVLLRISGLSFDSVMPMIPNEQRFLILRRMGEEALAQEDVSSAV